MNSPLIASFDIILIINHLCRMKNLFLYRLGRQAPVYLFFSLVFIGMYFVALYKKMDLFIFPLNNMFSENSRAPKAFNAPAIKINGKVLPVTNDLYLKKDFSEMSLLTFSSQLQRNGKSFMSEYIRAKNISEAKKEMLLQKLIPSTENVSEWPLWYAKFHGISLKAGDTVEVWSYQFTMENSMVSVTDSSLSNQQIIRH